MNPNRVATTYLVEYGTTASYGSQTTAVAAGSGSSAVAVSVPLTGLTSSTTYHARLVATSAGGTTNGPDLTFTTGDLPPSVTGTSAGSVTASGATISGSVNPNRVATTYRVEYGTTVAYGSQTTGVSAGSGSSAVAVSVPLTGLTSSTTLPRAPGRGERGRDDERPGPDLHDRATCRRRSRGTSAGSVTTSGATISGDVNPNRVATTYRVEYGTTAVVRVADDGRLRGVRFVGGRGERAADGPDVVDDVPRAPGRDERGRDDERAGPHLHDRRPAAVGQRHLRRARSRRRARRSPAA